MGKLIHASFFFPLDYYLPSWKSTMEESQTLQVANLIDLRSTEAGFRRKVPLRRCIDM
jgi:hypothetical protein